MSLRTFLTLLILLIYRDLPFQLEFVAEDIQNGYAYIGLDSIKLVDPLTYSDMCEEQLRPSNTSASLAVESFSAFIDPDPDSTVSSIDVHRQKLAGSRLIKINKIKINRHPNTPKDPFD